MDIGKALLAAVGPRAQFWAAARWWLHSIDRRAARPLILVLIAGVLGLALRLHGAATDEFSYDELLSVNFANDTPIHVLITALRFDVHPPLYYLQLALWMTVGTGALWIKLNSIAWSVIALASLFWIVRRVAGSPAGVTAMTLFAVLPGAVYYAQEVRMYALIMAAISWAWYFNHTVASGSVTSRRIIALMISEIAVIYSHGAGVVMLAGVVGYGFWLVLMRRDWEVGKSWGLTQILVGMTGLPAFMIAAGRGISHTIAPGIVDVVSTIGFVVFGPVAQGRLWLDLLAFGIILVLLGCAWRDTLARRVIVWTVLVPLTTIALMSVVLRPIWLPRTISFVIPFLCLSGALALRPVLQTLFVPATGRLAAGGFAILLAATNLLGPAGEGDRFGRYERGEGLRSAADWLRRVVRPTDIVYVDGTSFDFWCFAWYFVGPEWGTPLSIHDVNADWRRLLSRIGPDWAGRLGLAPNQTEIMARGTRMVAGAVAPIPDAADIPVWRIIYLPTYRDKESPGAILGRQLVDWRGFKHMRIERWQPEP